ncbi:hypothetical protein MKQ70_11070 [Chitinophaga sedimenti]|uniref:hypothetical protein n=1 Tax=Chitinophaga sedimenti TaxID=2033606 RepID=UPI002005E1AD|nr:hypothetical protein [Chitinophaga sedimenti]MCK7555519.1 hypothetical protein [Chitinophaga sedimenti]
MKRLLVLPMMGIAFASFAQQNPMAAQLEALQKEKDPAALQQKFRHWAKGRKTIYACSTSTTTRQNPMHNATPSHRYLRKDSRPAASLSRKRRKL